MYKGEKKRLNFSRSRVRTQFPGPILKGFLLSTQNYDRVLISGNDVHLKKHPYNRRTTK